MSSSEVCNVRTDDQYGIIASRSPTPQGPPTPKATPPKLASRPSIQSVLADRYVLGAELGRGAHGHVFKALDKNTGRFVAVKQISLQGVSKENLNSVMGEIDLLKDLDHKNIVQYFDSLKTRNHLYIVLEFMENGSLADVIKPNNFGAFPENLVSVYIAQVLEGLRYLHSQGVVHRDVKGANILTTKKGLVKLADFGVAAKLRDKGTTGSKEDYYNTVAGSPYWMAPEVIELTSVTPAADIWSLGCLVIELLTGYPPYYSECQPIQALYKIVQNDCPPLPPGISPLLEDFLRQCFHKEPSERPTADDLLMHEWVIHHRRTLKDSWNRSKGLKHTGKNESSRANVSAVVERILRHQQAGHNNHHDQVPMPETAESPVSLFRASSAPVSPVRDSAAQLHRPDGEEHSTHSGKSAPAGNRNPSHPRLWVSEIIQETRTADDYLMDGKVSPENGYGEMSRTAGPVNTDQIDIGLEEEVTVDTLREQRSALLAESSRVASGKNGFEFSGAQGRAFPLTAQLFGNQTNVEDSANHRLLDPLATSNFTSTLGSQQLSATLDTFNFTIRTNQGTLDRDHQEQLAVRRMLFDLRPHMSNHGVESAARILLTSLRSKPEQRALFIAEGGVLSVMELLNHRDLKVVGVVLELVNVLCEDLAIMGKLCMVGVAPSMFKYAAEQFPQSMRLQVAKFMHCMCFGNVGTLELFIASLGIPMLAKLLAEDLREDDQQGMILTHTALACIERIIEVHPKGVVNGICRLFAAGNVPHRLVMSLVSLVESLKKEEQARGSLHIDGNAENHVYIPIDSLPEQRPVAESLRGPHHSVTNSSGSNPSASSISESLSNNSTLEAAPRYQLADRAVDLLLLMSTCETVVKAHLCSDTTLKPLANLNEANASHSTPLYKVLGKVVKCLRNLSSDPELLDRFEDEGIVKKLVKLLGGDGKWDIKKEVLHTMLNLCKMDPVRRERAATAGIIPHLKKLARPLGRHEKVSSEERATREELRKMALELLCRMLTLSTSAIREELWKEEVLTLMLELLRDQQWQIKVLDAMASWLEEDQHQVERKFLRDDFSQLVSIVESYKDKTNEVSRVLDPILRMLRGSLKLSKQMAIGHTSSEGLAPVIVDMLKSADAATCLKLLEALKQLYAVHPRPKEFLQRYDIKRRLQALETMNGGAIGEVRVLVRKQAQELLVAFPINRIF